MEELKKVNINDFNYMRCTRFQDKKHFYVSQKVQKGTRYYENLQVWIEEYNLTVDFFNDKELKAKVNIESFYPSFRIIGPSLDIKKNISDMTPEEFTIAVQKYNQRYKNGNKNYFKIPEKITQEEFLKKYPGNKYALKSAYIITWYNDMSKIYQKFRNDTESSKMSITDEQLKAFEKIVQFCEQNGIKKTKKKCYTQDYAEALIDYYNKYRKDKDVKAPFPSVYHEDMKKYNYKGKEYNIGLFLRALRLSYSTHLGISGYDELKSGYLANWKTYEKFANMLDEKHIDWKTKRIKEGEYLDKKK